MCMKGKTQPMIKKTLPILVAMLVIVFPIIFVFVVSISIKSNSNENYKSYASDIKVFTNVEYSFDMIKHCYLVNAQGNNYRVPPKNVYHIEIISTIDNEYFVYTNELFVYHN